METIIYKFNSGLRLAYCNRSNVRSVGISVLCGVGSLNEDLSNNGISHFIEHMMFKGTEKRTSFEIVQELEMIGAQINAYTSKNSTCYYTISVDNDAEKCMEILSDMMFHSKFDAEEMAKEKKVVLEEISMSEDDNEDVCLELLSSTYFKNSTLGMQILGPRENVEKFTKKDIQDYMSKNYCSEDIVIAICGNISLDAAKEYVNKYFEGKFSSIKGRTWLDTYCVPNQAYVKKFKDIEQANISICMPGIVMGGKNEMTLKIVHSIFAGGMSSRLFQEIREKLGLAYSVYSYPTFYSNNGTNTLYIGTNKNSVEKAILSTKKVITDTINKGFSDQEVKKGIAQAKAGLVIGQESTSNLMRATAKSALFRNKPFDVDENLRLLDEITIEDVNASMKENFDLSKACVSYVGRELNIDLLDLLK